MAQPPTSSSYAYCIYCRLGFDFLYLSIFIFGGDAKNTQIHIHVFTSASDVISMDISAWQIWLWENASNSGLRRWLQHRRPHATSPCDVTGLIWDPLDQPWSSQGSGCVQFYTTKPSEACSPEPGHPGHPGISGGTAGSHPFVSGGIWSTKPSNPTKVHGYQIGEENVIQVYDKTI